eukprot:1011031-Rhodomonas_salina.1
MYPQQARTADAGMVAVARVAFCMFVLLFVLMIPLRSKRVTFSHHEQFILFNVLEVAARLLPLVIFWRYLVAP